ncbi:hypothetical protein O2N63_04000 [Aliiroseovarius sp. KMU-50]|uniref:Uncharacterized protein n=1 Tax=Aliiroseovarius salicola TaxID=3009082 RepID=A0ABT4W083_9RHOB|nr:hypothetical protein [Aliiroseovarius sp. KMU-50]MDA5093242.1 hypothetical protein [Aliiroseovarius sp. KMU-50]
MVLKAGIILAAPSLFFGKGLGEIGATQVMQFHDAGKRVDTGQLGIEACVVAIRIPAFDLIVIVALEIGVGISVAATRCAFAPAFVVELLSGGRCLRAGHRHG